MKRLLLFFALLCLMFIQASAQTNAQVTLIDPPVADDDRVTLGVRVSGIDPRQLAALTADNFTVGEPYTDLTIIADPRLPITLGVVVNLSVNSELSLIQRTLRAYFDAHYREGDAVTFTLLTGRAPVTIEAPSKADIDAVIDGLQVSTIYFSLADVLPDVAESLAEAQAADPERAAIGLLVGSFINNASDVAAAEAFVDMGIPLHIVQAHTFRENFTANMRRMAAETGGIFVNNQAGALVNGDSLQAVGALKVLYDALDASRIVFTVSYTSTALDLTAEPTIQLQVQLGANDIVSLPFSYQRRFDPPVVEFANPSITAARRSSRLADGSPSFDNEGQEIAVYVRFPDAVPRAIRSLQLEVLDEIRGAVVQSELIVDPQPAPDGSYRVRWDLSGYKQPGTITPVVIAVTVTDELGLTGRTAQEASVTVAALPPLPTPTPLPPTATFTPLPPTATFTAVPPTVAPTALPSVLDRFNTNVTIGGQPVNAENLIYGLGLIVLCLVGITAVLMLRLRRIRRQVVANGGTYLSGAPNPSHMDMPTPLPAGDADATQAEKRTLGRLIVKRGLPPQEIPVDMPQFVIGRKAGEGINLAIDAPYISPRHCMITFRNNRFLIRDLGSKNGTFVNGERILPERDTIVPNGSEVEITRQVVFELWDPDTVVRIDYQTDDVRTERLHSTNVRLTTAVDSVSFPSALGIRAAEDDDGEIGEDYSPV
jgi:hypothetical protein